MGNLKDTIKKRLADSNFTKSIEGMVRKWEECAKKGHPNKTYLHSSNSGRDNLMYDNYSCPDCPSIIKEYNHQKTLDFRGSLKRHITI